MSRVKDCPFCGGLAKSKSYYNPYEGTGYFIGCIQCGATSSHRPTEELAIDIWNSRVELMELRNAVSVKPEPKKYYLKHKFLGSEDFNYLNYKVITKDFELKSKCCDDNFQTQFTEEEIKMLEDSGFDLTNFERIEVGRD